MVAARDSSSKTILGCVVVYRGPIFFSGNNPISHKLVLTFFLWLLKLAILYHFKVGEV